MSVDDLWEGYTKAQIADARRRGLGRWKHRWYGPERTPSGQLKAHSRTYKDAQKAEAFLADSQQQGGQKAASLARSAVTVSTLLDRHLATKADRAPGTVAIDRNHARHVREAFGDRVVSTLTPTEIETWAVRTGVAAESRKKQVEILRASIKRGIRDRLVDYDPTEGIVVSLGHRERPSYSSDQLMAIISAARDDMDRALLGVLGLMGLRSGEARSLTVGDLRGDHLSVVTGGATADRTKTRASRRLLPIPATLRPWLTALAGDRPRTAWLFPSPRKAGAPVAEQYANQALTRAIARANAGREDPIPRHSAHALRHTFAAISLSELGADLLAVSRAMGHARPSITLDRYGHLAPAGLAPLMTRIDELAAPHLTTPDDSEDTPHE